jgi:hypothetical protein
MHTIPSVPELSLTDDEVSKAVRFRLLLSPHQCPVSVCVCGVSFTDDPYHSFSCSKFRKALTNIRHELVAKAIVNTCQAVNVPVFCEPVGLSRVQKVRPDLEIYAGGQRVLVDVAITYAATNSYAAESSRTSLYAAGLMEKRKIDKYKDLAAQNEALFLPFVCEASGAFGKDTEKLLEILAGEASELWQASEVRSHLKHRVAIAIQKGNARIINGCVVEAIARTRLA